MKEQCSFCGNTNLSAKQVRYIYARDGVDMMVVEGVPCVECDFCHEQYFEATSLKKIEQDFLAVSNRRKKPRRCLQVACEEYALL